MLVSLDAKELIRHCHENANKWVVDDGVFDVKTMDELVAVANTDRLEWEGGVGGVSSSSVRRVSDGDEDSDLKDAILAWAMCDINL